MLSVEFTILDFIRNNLTSTIMDKIMVFITTLGNGGGIWIIIALLMLLSKKYRKTGIMLATGLLVCLVAGNLILKPLIARPRPFLVKEGIRLIINAPKDFSFPSGHTLSSVICAVILFLRCRSIGVYALILAVLIGFSRLYLYVHFPSDVLFGALIGVIIAFACVKTVNYFFEKYSKHTN